VCADFDTLAGQAYASEGKLLPVEHSASGKANDVAGDRAPRSRDRSLIEGFARSQERFVGLAGWLSGEEAGALGHTELEERLVADGRELVLALLQDSLDLRALREQRVGQVVGSDGVRRANVERGHERALSTVVGEVRLGRLAYRAPGAGGGEPVCGRRRAESARGEVLARDAAPGGDRVHA
jgi:hypothetical protein